jgi:hypothetical protein
MVADEVNTQPKFWETIPTIKTELIHIGSQSVVKATVVVGQMTVTSFSDTVEDSTNNSFQDYERQATQRAMKLVPHS